MTLILIFAATLPWKDRVARSISSMEANREEARREQQIIGEGLRVMMVLIMMVMIMAMIMMVIMVGRIMMIMVMMAKAHPHISGQVLDQTQPGDRIHIKARLVRFSWQRGVKIGQ